MPIRRLPRWSALSILLCIFAFAQDVSPRPTICIRLYDYANLQPEVIEQAQKHAARVLALAGVELEWMPCRVAAFPNADAGCERSIGRNDILMSVLPRTMAAGFHQPKNALAFSGLTAGGKDDQRVWIFYDSIREMGERDASSAQILGHVEAHELGHLLMHEPGHTRNGLMRAHWSSNELHSAAQGALLFDREQAAIIRAEVERRSQIAQAAGQ